jgi:uncharacterized membrane protein
MNARTAWFAACALWIALILLGLAWELRLAPLKPGGSWLVLKVLPLLIPLRGLLHGRRKSFQGACLLIWLYAAEGGLRAFSDPGPSARLALLQAAIAIAFFAAAVLYLRATRSPGKA